MSCDLMVRGSIAKPTLSNCSLRGIPLAPTTTTMYVFKEIGPEPKYPIVQRVDILRWIGVTWNVFKQVRDEGMLPWKRLTPNGHRYYRTADVRRVFLNNFKS